MPEEPLPPTETPVEPPVVEEPQVPSEPALEVQPESPEETPVEAEAAPTEEEKPNQEAKPPESPKKTQDQKRIDRITAQKHQAIRNAEYWRAVAEGRITVPKVTQPAESIAPTFDKPEPKQEDFDEIADFLRASLRYEIHKIRFEEAQQKYEEQAKSTQQQQFVTQQQADKARFDYGVQKYSDFDAVSDELGEIASDVMINLLFKSDVFADLSYHLGKNIEEAERIAALPVEEQIYEVKALEKRFKSSNPPVAQGQAPNKLSAPRGTTQAPPPVPRAGANDVASVSTERLAYREYVARRAKELGRPIRP